MASDVPSVATTVGVAEGRMVGAAVHVTVGGGVAEGCEVGVGTMQVAVGLGVELGDAGIAVAMGGVSARTVAAALGGTGVDAIPSIATVSAAGGVAAARALSFP